MRLYVRANSLIKIGFSINVFDLDQDAQSTLGKIIIRKIVIDHVVYVKESSSFG